MAEIVMRHTDLNQTIPGHLGVILFAACLSLINVSLANAQMPVVTTGAAPGYVEDITCKDCHLSHYESYQSVGMAQSFKKPGNAKLLEKFGETFFHEPLQRFYQINRRDDELTFRRFQRDFNGDVINEIEIPIDWMLGSGNRSRSYLYQTELGEMFQLPIGWYSEGGFWEMSPGFESANHDGITRRVKRGCLFCHNAFPEVEQDA